MGFALIGATQVLPISSFRFNLAREIGFHPGISLVDLGDAVGRRPSPARPPWSTRDPHGRLSQWRRLW